MTQVKTFNRRTFLKTGVIGAGAVALATAGCKPTDDEETDDPNNGNGGNPNPTPIPSATAVKNAIIAYVIECEKNHKHSTLEECATCLSTFIETENKDYESDFLFGIGKVGGDMKVVDRITMDPTSKVGTKLTGERDIKKGFLGGVNGETALSGSYEHHITNKAK